MTGQTEQHDWTTVELVVADPHAVPAALPAPPSTGILAQVGRCGRWFRRTLELVVFALTRWLAHVVGLICLVIGLSVLAAIPLLQFLSAGYMFEASARVARSGRLRDGLFGLDRARQLGTICICGWLMFLPIRMIAHLAQSSEWINGLPLAESVTSLGSTGGADMVTNGARPWWLILALLLTMALLHGMWACYRGGRLRDFFWPAPRQLWRELRRGGLLDRASSRFWQWLPVRQWMGHFWLGSVACLGGLLWLAPPVTLLVVAAQSPGLGGGVLGLIGALFLAWVIRYLPALQTQLALTRNWRSLWDLERIRSQQAHAPLAHACALIALLVAAVPLYLLKAELVPREAAWMPNVLFVASILPAKLLVGWAMFWGAQSPPAHIVWRSLATLLGIPIVAIYLLIVYATQFTSWYGLASLYEQHAFLLPVPFLSW